MKFPVPTCLLLLFASLSRLFGQSLEGIELHSIDAADFPIVWIAYSARQAGNFTPGPDYIVIREGGDSHRVYGMDEEHAPASIALAIDSSGSMEGSMEDVLSAASDLLSLLDGGDEAEIIDFDSRVRSIHDFSGDRDSLRGSLGEITAGGATALYDSISLGLDDVQSRNGQPAVVLLTDGKDEKTPGVRQSRLTLEQLKRKVREAGIPIYIVGLGQGVDRPVLDGIAEHSGGKAYYAEESDTVTDIYRGILSYLHSLRRIYFRTKNGAHDGSARRISLQIRDSVTTVDGVYTAPGSEYWSYALWPFTGWDGYNATPLAISPDGSVIVEGAFFGVFTREGRRISGGTDWGDTRRCTLGSGLLFSQGGWGWQGSLHRFEGERIDTMDVDYSGFRGNYHADWEWNTIGLSRNAAYALLVARVDRKFQEFGFYFALLDRNNGEILWEQGLYGGEFDEPGDIEIAHDGTAYIIQNFNLFVVDKEGKLLYRRMYDETGKRYWHIAVSGDGSRWIAFLDGWETDLEQEVETSDREGSRIWGVVSENHESPFIYNVDVSENGLYFGVCDETGVRIFDREGKQIYSDQRNIPDKFYGTGLAIANDGSFVYGLANRMYYRRLH